MYVLIADGLYHTADSAMGIVNPLKGEHVLVSPHRTKRPWKVSYQRFHRSREFHQLFVCCYASMTKADNVQGQTDPPVLKELPKHDPECYLCPGNTRTGGFVNPAYEQTYVRSFDVSCDDGVSSYGEMDR